MYSARRHILSAIVLAFAAATVGAVAADKGTSQGSAKLQAVMVEGTNQSHAMKMTGDVDKDSASMMTRRHQQAIDMVKVYDLYAQNTEPRQKAKKMADQQGYDPDLRRFR